MLDKCSIDMTSRTRARRGRHHAWMSFADYGQSAEDHQSLLVLVTSVGSQLKPKSFSRVYERISRLNTIPILGQNRTLHVRYKQSYPLENNEWGDFQAHRKVLGLICVGKCSNDAELVDLYAGYDELKLQYGSTLFDSRLVVFGLSEEGTTLPPELRRNSSVESDVSDKDEKLQKARIEDNVNSNIADDDSPKKKKATFVINPDDSNHNKKEKQDLSKEQFEDPLSVNNSPKKVPSPDAEDKSQINGKEVNPPTVMFYPTIEDSLDLEDSLREFAASLFWVLESKRLDRSQERQEKLPLLMTPFEKKDFVGIDTESRLYRKRCHGRLRKHLADLCMLAGLSAEAMLHYQTALDVLRSASDWLWLAAAYEGLCSASVVLMYPQLERPSLGRNLSFSVKRGASAISEAKLKPGIGGRSFANGLDLADSRSKSTVLPDDLIDKYKEAIMHYSKFKNAGIIEMEASIKACRVLIMQQKYLEATEFLQNVVYINLQMTDEEKIQRYSTLSVLYGQIGMQRKSSFFKRVAAMQCVAPQNPKPAWPQCYHLLLQALEGYKLSLDPHDIPLDYAYGWPIVQLRVLHELIYSARRMGNPQFAVRHLTLLLHAMFDHLSPQERKEMANVLESYTVKTEGTTTTIALDNGVLLPPIPLIKFPTVRSVKLQNLAPHLRPVKVKSKEAKVTVRESPFIYSPISMTTTPRHKDKSKMEFEWVEGDLCEVALQVYNPMPFELKVSNMGLLTQGGEVESYPASLTLPAESGPLPVKIMALPKKPGHLSVIGYTTHVLGVKSNCKLRDVQYVKEDQYEIHIVPALPQMSVETSLPKAASFSSMADSASVVTSATANIFSGQRCECEVTLTNTGKHSVDRIDLSLDSRIQPDLLNKVFTWNPDNIRSQLPLAPNAQATFTVHIYGASDFLPMDMDLPFSPRSRSNRWFVGEVGDSATEDGADAVVVEALLKVQYSGGPGLAEGYSRQCSVALNVDILPAVVFRKWNVLPTDSLHECHLVLDMENCSSHEVEVKCADNPPLVIEGKHTKRLAIKFERITFPDFAEVPLQPRSKYMESCQVTRYDMYSQHMAQFVDIRWSMPETNCQGHASIERLRWNEQQITMIRKSPVQWEVYVNGQVYNSSKAVETEVGHPLDVSCVLTNNSDCDIEDGYVSIDVYHDMDNGSHLSKLDGQLTVLGANSSPPQQIVGGETITHQVTFVFLCQGHFKVNMSCTGVKGQSSSDQAIGNKDTERHLQIWKSTPPVEIKVIEQSDDT